MSTGATGMDDALGDPLMVEVSDLLAHDEVFEQRRPTHAGLEGVLVVGNLHTLIGAQGLAGGIAAHAFQALHLGVGVGPVRRVGSGQLAVPGRIRSLWHVGSPRHGFQAPRSGSFL